jgi:pimeloyl-ACP methyl ester carboxylesterase
MPTADLPAGPVEYHDTGGDGPVIVFLHGLLMNGSLWRAVTPTLRGRYRCVMPTLPLGSHRQPMNPDADLSLSGMVGIVADFLDHLDLQDVTLVHSDWGGALFLTALGRDERVGRHVVCSCEAFDNFPPGLPGRLVTIAARIPGGVLLALHQFRIGALRRSRLMLGHMAKRPVPDDLVAEWTAPALGSPEIRRDLRKYARRTWPKARLVEATRKLADFTGPTLVLWAPETDVMPPAHGAQLAALVSDGRLIEISDSYVLVSLDQPEIVAESIDHFVRSTAVPRH